MSHTVGWPSFWISRGTAGTFWEGILDKVRILPSFPLHHGPTRPGTPIILIIINRGHQSRASIAGPMILPAGSGLYMYRMAAPASAGTGRRDRTRRTAEVCDGQYRDDKGARGGRS